MEHDAKQDIDYHLCYVSNIEEHNMPYFVARNESKQLRAKVTHSFLSIGVYVLVVWGNLHTTTFCALDSPKCGQGRHYKNAWR